MAYPPFPVAVYLDSSFLIPLLTYKRDPENTRCQKCKQLYDHLLASDCRLVASLFTLEETIYILFFRQKLLSEAKNNRFENLKQFKSADPSQYKAIYTKHSGIPRLIVGESKALGIHFEYPRSPDPRIDFTKRIREYAVGLLRKYWQLDSKDAFHVAIARCLRIQMLISCDSDFSTVREIASFNPLSAT